MMFGNGKFHDNFGDLHFISSFKNMAEASDHDEMAKFQEEMELYAKAVAQLMINASVKPNSKPRH
jgi:hypothetical protein